MEEVKDIIENILYWEICPEEYKERLAKAYGLEKVLEEINNTN
jgi:hypothetical protein